MKKLLILLTFIISANYIFASCGSAVCPLYISNPLSAGLLSLNLSYEYIYQDEIYVGSSRAFIGAVPGHHNEVSTMNRITNLGVGYGITDFLRMELLLPYIQRDHSHIHIHKGEEITERWNYSGIGDAVISLNYLLINNISDAYSLRLNAGLKLPSGAAAMTNSEGEAAEVTIQPGSGSTDFILGFAALKELSSVPMISGNTYSSIPLEFSALYKMNGKGTDDFRFGNDLQFHVATAYRFLEKLSLLLQVNARFQQHADAGITGEPEENTGGKWVFVSPGLKYYITDFLSLYGYFQVPVYQYVNGIQQAAPYNFRIGISNEITL